MISQGMATARQQGWRYKRNVALSSLIVKRDLLHITEQFSFNFWWNLKCHLLIGVRLVEKKINKKNPVLNINIFEVKNQKGSTDLFLPELSSIDMFHHGNIAV